MRLLVDIGNTQIKYVFQESSTAALFSDVVYCDYATFLSKLAKNTFSNVCSIIVANVKINEIAAEIEFWASQYGIAFLQVHSQAKAFGVCSSYQQPVRLGVDRWLALIAAHQLYPKMNVLIIDAGTATTVDLLTVNGEHLGGWIMPGVQTMFDSLLRNTEKIIAEPINIANVSFGVDSSECVNYGTWAMTLGAIKEAVIQANTLLPLDKVVLTGGNSKQIINLLPENYELVPKLLFHGLSCFQASL
jgi:type III pantothenate kinase